MSALDDLRAAVAAVKEENATFLANVAAKLQGAAWDEAALQALVAKYFLMGKLLPEEQRGAMSRYMQPDEVASTLAGIRQQQKQVIDAVLVPA
jgi:hypothetical protein